jgi:SAM-dependent methyltransferase
MIQPNYTAFFKHLQQSIEENAFVMLTCGNYNGLEPNLKRLKAKGIVAKRQYKLSFTFTYTNKDIVKNFSPSQAIELVKTIVSAQGFKQANLFTTSNDYILDLNSKENWSLKQKPATQVQAPSLSHDKEKKRAISTYEKQYLHALNITNNIGEVYKNAQDKYKQINHYIEILSSLLKDLPKKEILNVVDMGAGKGYLTFALYDYLTHVLDQKTHITGVEYRLDLVTLCNEIAQSTGFNDLKFVQGSIETYNDQTFNVLIALHACDTATDDAIAKGIHAKADLIVVAPCCHKQIRREMEKAKPKTALAHVVRHGIFMERQAEMITDTLRALLLEKHGYATKVIEFISNAHTPKNVLIVASKKANFNADTQDIDQKIDATKTMFGVRMHYLEQILVSN